MKVHCELSLSEHLVGGSRLSQVGPTQSQAQIHFGMLLVTTASFVAICDSRLHRWLLQTDHILGLQYQQSGRVCASVV